MFVEIHNQRAADLMDRFATMASSDSLRDKFPTRGLLTHKTEFGILER